MVLPAPDDWWIEAPGSGFREELRGQAAGMVRSPISSKCGVSARAPSDTRTLHDLQAGEGPRSRISPVSMVCQRLRTSRSPSSSTLASRGGRSATWLTSWSRSTVNSAVTLTTDGLGNRSSGSVTLPGSRLSRVFDVIAATITVVIRDRLNRSEEITTAGLRYPGDEPTGSPKSVHQTSPRATTPSRRSRSSNELPPMIRGPSVPWRARRPVRPVGP